MDDQAVISAGDPPEGSIREVRKGQASDRHGQGEQREPRHHVEAAVVHVGVGLPERGRQFAGVGAFGQVGLRLPAAGRETGVGDQLRAEGEGWDGGIWGTAVRVRPRKLKYPKESSG